LAGVFAVVSSAPALSVALVATRTMLFLSASLAIFVAGFGRYFLRGVFTFAEQIRPQAFEQSGSFGALF
tara:strand:+ start:1034 stop:1240 length:207 start_codon:yes stop_codon:yes gene_type:complete